WSGRLGNQALAGANGYSQFVAIHGYPGEQIYSGSVDGQLWVTPDGGSSWTEIDGGSPGLPAASISYIVVNNPGAGSSSTVYVGYSGTGTGHLYSCASPYAAPRVWTKLDGTGANALPDISLNAIALDINDPINTIYVGTDIGVFYTT